MFARADFGVEHRRAEKVVEKVAKNRQLREVTEKLRLKRDLFLLLIRDVYDNDACQV